MGCRVEKLGATVKQWWFRTIQIELMGSGRRRCNRLWMKYWGTTNTLANTAQGHKELQIYDSENTRKKTAGKPIIFLLAAYDGESAFVFE